MNAPMMVLVHPSFHPQPTSFPRSSAADLFMFQQPSAKTGPSGHYQNNQFQLKSAAGWLVRAMMALAFAWLAPRASLLVVRSVARLSIVNRRKTIRINLNLLDTRYKSWTSIIAMKCARRRFRSTRCRAVSVWWPFCLDLFATLKPRQNHNLVRICSVGWCRACMICSTTTTDCSRWLRGKLMRLPGRGQEKLRQSRFALNLYHYSSD